MPESIAYGELFEMLAKARSDVIESNTEFLRAKARFDEMLDAYVDARNAWRAAVARLDYLEGFELTEDGRMVRSLG